LGTTP